MDRFFSILGKLVIVLIVLGSMTYAGYYFGSKSKEISKPEALKTENNQDISSPVPTVEPLLTINGGISKNAGLSFDQYTLKASDKWQVSEEKQTALDEKLILTKDGFSISIFQAATGGALCLYNGDPDFEGPSSRFVYYKEITTLDGRTLRRSGDLNATSFTVCQKGQDGSFQQPTNYGHISIKLPVSDNQQMLNEIDIILSSLKKIN